MPWAESQPRQFQTVDKTPKSASVAQCGKFSFSSLKHAGRVLLSPTIRNEKPNEKTIWRLEFLQLTAADIISIFVFAHCIVFLLNVRGEGFSCMLDLRPNQLE